MALESLERLDTIWGCKHNPIPCEIGRETLHDVKITVHYGILLYVKITLRFLRIFSKFLFLQVVVVPSFQLLEYIGQTSPECLLRPGEQLNVPDRPPEELTVTTETATCSVVLKQKERERDYYERHKNDSRYGKKIRVYMF